jgi:hypothetical protein
MAGRTGPHGAEPPELGEQLSPAWVTAGPCLGGQAARALFATPVRLGTAGAGRRAAFDAGAAPQLLELADDRVQALAVDELHRVVADLAILADLEDRHDIGVM